MKEFDDLLEETKGSGRFGGRLTWFVVAPVFFLMPFQFLHQIFVLHIPGHYCRPPAGLEPEALGMNVSWWRRTFLPSELGPDHRTRQSPCRMFDVTNDTLSGFLDRVEDETWPTVPCGDGYVYDRTEFANTAVTDNDWVCDLDHRATDLFTVGTAGLIVGTAFFSAFADWKGRKPAFVFASVIVIVFQTVKIWLSHNYTAYAIVKFVAFVAMMPLFQTPLNVSTEMETADRRGVLVGVACVAWALGNMFLPLLGYLVPRWKWLTLASILPMGYVFFTLPIIPESARWLVTKGRVKEAEKIFVKMARVNKTKVPEDLEQRLRGMALKTKEKSYGYMTLLSSSTMAKRTICVTVVFTASSFVYYQLVINIGNMAGNTFLNMFLLALVEGPGSMFGIFAADRLGRRWVHASFLLLNAVSFFLIMCVAHDPSLTPLVTFLCMLGKFNVSATFGVSYVQAMEIFATPVRQSGIGMCTLMAQTISIGGPYVIYLGLTDLRLPYAVMFLVCLVGAVAAAILPETAGKTLPETIADAENFGKNDKFFSWHPPFRNNESRRDHN